MKITQSGYGDYVSVSLNDQEIAQIRTTPNTQDHVAAELSKIIAHVPVLAIETKGEPHSIFLDDIHGSLEENGIRGKFGIGGFLLHVEVGEKQSIFDLRPFIEHIAKALI